MYPDSIQFCYYSVIKLFYGLVTHSQYLVKFSERLWSAKYQHTDMIIKQNHKPSLKLPKVPFLPKPDHTQGSELGLTRVCGLEVMCIQPCLLKNMFLCNYCNLQPRLRFCCDATYFLNE